MKSIGIVPNEEYARIIPRMAYYLKNENIGGIFKYKCPLFGAAVEQWRIYLFSNSLEQMGTFWGHKGKISSLCRLSIIILASGSYDRGIKIWNTEKRVIISTLSGHTDTVSALCDTRVGQLVSGSFDKSLIIWSKLDGCPTYSHKQILRGHTSEITVILRISKREIISGEWNGDLMIWDIAEAVCTRHIPHVGIHGLYQMKLHQGGEVDVTYNWEINVWGAANNWGNPLKHFALSAGYSIEFLSDTLLLRGGSDGRLEFVDYAQFPALPYTRTPFNCYIHYPANSQEYSNHCS